MKNFIKKLKAPTPKKWAKVRTFFASLASAFAAGITAVKAVDITMPQWFYIVAGALIFIFTAIGVWAQSHEQQPGSFG